MASLGSWLGGKKFRRIESIALPGRRQGNWPLKEQDRAGLWSPLHGLSPFVSHRPGNMAYVHPAALSRWGNSDDRGLLCGLVTKSRAVAGPVCNPLHTSYSVEAVGWLANRETNV